MSDTTTPQIVRVIASSSSGNATFVRLGDTRLLIDAGVSARRIRTGLADLGESVGALDAVLVTHEHSDHIRGLHKLRRPLGDAPIFCTAGTGRKLKTGPKAVGGLHRVEAGADFHVGGVHVTPFALPHDANEPVGYRLETDTTAIAVATDLGESTAEVEHALMDCQLLLLESNHCPAMLRAGPYPWFLKRRVGSNKGHLSNDQARDLLRRVAGPRLERVVLCHLSEKNNDPDKAATLCGQGVEAAGFSAVDVRVASRKTPSPAIHLDASAPHGRPTAPARPPSQMGFGFMNAL